MACGTGHLPTPPPLPPVLAILTCTSKYRKLTPSRLRAWIDSQSPLPFSLHTIREFTLKKAIIVGASSGIGKALAKLLAKNGFIVGLVARRLELLLELQREIGEQALVRQIDVADTHHAIAQFSEFVQEMGQIDLIIISAGTGFINPELDWEKENETIAVNVAGFAAIANVAVHHFLKNATGHLVNISSIAAIRGSGSAPAYNASKAFESIYLDGLRQKIVKLGLPITITDIQPGFVDTAMAQGEGLFWVASPDEAAKQIYQAISRKKKHAYITKRWRLVAFFLRLVPDSIYYRL
jgi:short-subunit dehydrogenase